MKLSLRKANALQGLIQEQINEPFVGNVTISRYDNVDEVYDVASLNLTQNIYKKLELINAYCTIRDLTSLANSSYGVDILLTDFAANEKFAAVYKQLAATPVSPVKKEQIPAILADLAKQTDTYGRTKDAVTVSLISKQSIDEYKAKVIILRKEKQAISDKLLHLNVSTEIELGETEVAVLLKYDIL